MLTALLTMAPSNGQTPRYLATRKIDHVDDYHGTKVADPYRWLEDETSAETAAWVEAQNAVTFPYLERIPFRGALLARVTELNDYERFSAPVAKGPYFFFSKNTGLQNQSVLYIQKGADGAPEVLLDPNTWSADGTVQLAAFEPSRDAKYAVYGLSQSGSDWQQYKVMELATKRTLTDTVDWVKVSNVAWHGDGFYYSRYPEPPEGREKASINENHLVYFHKLGTPQSADTLVYEDAANPQRFHIVYTTEDERFAILEVSDRGKGKDGNALFVRDLNAPGEAFRPLVPEITNDTFSVVDNVGGEILVATNHGAPNWRVVAIDPAKPAEANWRTVLAERPEPLEGARTAGGKLFATYLKDVTTRAYVHSLGRQARERDRAAGPRHGGRLRRAERRDGSVLHVQLVERPDHDLSLRHRDAREQRIPRAARAGLRRAAFETKQVFYPSKDGTRVPMFLVYRKGLKLDGNNPTLLYGYGGFNIVVTPSFSAARVALLEQGVVYASANLRGGGEYGESWHEPGMKLEEAERVRRLHRRGRVADREEVHVARQARDSGRLERRAAGRRGDDPAARAVPRRHSAGRRDGHAALPQIHDRLGLDSGLRLERRRRRSSRRCFAYSPLHNIKRRREVSGHADHDGRSRRPRRACALVQIRRDVAGARERRESGADPHRDEVRPRREQPHEGARDDGGHLRVHDAQPRRHAGRVAGALSAVVNRP